MTEQDLVVHNLDDLRAWFKARRWRVLPCPDARPRWYAIYQVEVAQRATVEVQVYPSRRTWQAGSVTAVLESVHVQARSWGRHGTQTADLFAVPPRRFTVLWPRLRYDLTHFARELQTLKIRWQQ